MAVEAANNAPDSSTRLVRRHPGGAANRIRRDLELKTSSPNIALPASTVYC
jgi:hypothetical protein